MSIRQDSSPYFSEGFYYWPYLFQHCSLESFLLSLFNFRFNLILLMMIINALCIIFISVQGLQSLYSNKLAQAHPSCLHISFLMFKLATLRQHLYILAFVIVIFVFKVQCHYIRWIDRQETYSEQIQPYYSNFFSLIFYFFLSLIQHAK